MEYYSPKGNSNDINERRENFIKKCLCEQSIQYVEYHQILTEIVKILKCHIISLHCYTYKIKSVRIYNSQICTFSV